MTAIDEIKSKAMALSLKERASLAESLLSSLPPVTEVWSETKELEEAHRRDAEIESSQVQALHDSEFWQQVEARRNP